MNKHFMVDVETTGTVRGEDKILEIALVELEWRDKGYGYYWHPTGRRYSTLVHYDGQPKTLFAQQHMARLYELCNAVDPSRNVETIREEIYNFIHAETYVWNGNPFIPSREEAKPKFFMGWNASNFDLPMLFAENYLTPCYYVKVGDKEELRGDVHYRIYEQTGSLNILRNITGFSNETLKAMAVELDPTGLTLPEGKIHDALYDCCWQIKMQNGLIALGRRGWVK